MRKLVLALAVLAAALGVAMADHNCEAGWNFCQNNGVCHDDRVYSIATPWGPPTCVCQPRYGDSQCARYTRECNLDQPCANGGTCSDDATCTSRAGGDCYSCSCRPGYGGWQCREQNACHSMPCWNGGTCNPGPLTPTTYTCQCFSNSTGGYVGTNCETWSPSFDCTRDPCLNGGTCQGGGSFCQCLSTFGGRWCERPNFCESSPCANGATCNPASETCSCTSSYSGAFCTTPRFCSSSPCQNGGTCTNTGPSSGLCTCTTSYWGTFCQNLWTEEGCYHGQCSNGGACPAGCNGPNAASCYGANFDTVCNCPTVGPGANKWGDCQCNSTVVNNCPQNSNGCLHGGTCVSHQTGFGCTCPPGFYGEKCENYDNGCQSRNPCQNNGRCSLSRVWSSAKFQHYKGYDVAVCDCQYPYYGVHCENKAEVDTLCYVENPCNGGNCTMNTYTNGYYSVLSLYNNQRYEENPFFCQCPTGRYGLRCEDTVAPTASDTCTTLLATNANWCQNGGTCLDSTVLPSCACRCGYGGDNCEIVATAASRVPGNLLDFCSSQGDVCHNGGTCYNDMLGQTFYCNCAAGWWGTRCDKEGKSAGAVALPSLLLTLAAIAVALKARF